MGLRQTSSGAVVSLCRYPVKSMMGEELNAVHVTKRGLFGDRAYAIVDRSDGKVASAKNPRKWPHLFDFRAALLDSPTIAKIPPVRITLPDGVVVNSGEEDLHGILSRALGRDVTLESLHWTDGAWAAVSTATAEGYWPDMDGLSHRDTVTDFGLPEGTFFDCAFVHVMTTATLDRLRALEPAARFEARRFRPNIMVEAASGETEFVENAWVGRTLAIGETVRLSITGPCARCVMTTLAQGDLPRDLSVLRTAAGHNHANVGVYASVLQDGKVQRGDPVRLE